MNRCHSAIVSTQPPQIQYVFTDAQIAQIAAMSELRPGIASPDDVRAGKLADTEVLFSTWGMPAFTDDELALMPNLKIVFYAAGATDYFVRPLFKRGIRVMSAWQMNAIPVAEFCYAQILLGLKGYFRNVREVREFHSWNREITHVGPGVYGETVALIGAGSISSILRQKLESHNLNVIVVPSRPERRTVSIADAFAKAFVISNHLPNRTDNIHSIGRREFEAMRPGAVFLNTGRGAQIDEQALIDVFSKRTDLTALLDVTMPEPPAEDSPLYTLPNVRVSTHIAGSLNDEVHRMSDCAIKEFEHYLAGEPVQYLVSEDMLLSSK